MQEIFYEESVETHNSRKAKTKYTLFNVFMWLSFIAAFLGFIMIMFSPAKDENGTAFSTPVIINLVVWLVFTVLMLVCGIFLNIKRHSFFLSYDYTFVTGDIRISKVIHNRKRKLQFKFSTDCIIKIGRVGSDTYNKIKCAPDTKEVILTPNEEAENDKEFYYIQAQTEAGKRLLVIETRIDFISHIVRFMRKNILESEFNR